MEKDKHVEDRIGLATKSSEFQEIPTNDIGKKLLENYLNASHCMVYSKGSIKILDEFTPKATILMQMRFDGHLGFPGGVVDSGETVYAALERELEEEMGCPQNQQWSISSDDHLFSQVSHNKQLVTHFFTKEVEMDTLIRIEEAALKTKDYGSEVLGVIRVPLYTMADGYRGLPAFLDNKFIGNAKEQLIRGLIAKEILTGEDINSALSACPKYT